MDHDIFYYFPQAKKEGQNHSIFHISHADVYSWGWMFPYMLKGLVWGSGNGRDRVHWLCPKIFSLGWLISLQPSRITEFTLFGQFATEIRKSPPQQKLLPQCILHVTRPDYDGSIGTACPNPHMFIFKPNDTLISFLPRYRTTYGWPCHTCLQVGCVCHRLSQEFFLMQKLAH